MSEVQQVDRMLGRNDAVLTVHGQATILMAAKKMRRHRVGCLVVIDSDGCPVGIVTERDLVQKVLAGGKDPGQVNVEHVMSDQLISVTTKVSITKAQAIMAEHGIRHLPVIEDGLLLGMISIRDVVTHQLGAVKSILQRQMKLFKDLQAAYPDLVA